MSSPPPVLSFETLAAERPRYTSSLLFVPGLWSTAAAWRRLMSFLAHRGWECAAADFARTPGVGLDRRREALEAHLAGVSPPPVIVGHDLGALLALSLPAGAARAVVAVTPHLPAAFRSQTYPFPRGLGTRLRLWRAQPLPPPTGRPGLAWFGPLVGTASPEPAEVIAGARGDRWRPILPSATPTLVVAGELDPFSPPDDARRLAEARGAAFRLVAGGTHALPWEDGWDKRGGEIHRWLVQTLGESLLMPPEEDD